MSLPGDRRSYMPWHGVLAILLLGACSDTTEAPAAFEVAKVNVFAAEAVEDRPVRRIAGVVRPYQRAQLGTRQAGTVESVLVKAGERVTAGQDILRIDARDLQAARAAARLQLQAAEAGWRQATQQRDRFERLYEQQLVAKVRLEEVELQAERARGALEQARAELDAIEINLDYATVRAPFAGVVSEVIAETGTFVAPGLPLVIFENREQLEVEAGVDQAGAARLVVGDQLVLSAHGIDVPVMGQLQAVLPSLAGTGVGLRLRVLIEAPPAELLPGMVAEVHLPSPRSARDVVKVPEDAILRRGQLVGVFVVTTDSSGQARARLRWVSVAAGEREEGWVYITRGLAAGEPVIVGSLIDDLTDDQPVRRAN